MNTNKTWSRELGVVMFAVLIYFAVRGNTDVLNTLVWPFMTFITAAFSLKQEAITSITQANGK